MDKQDFIDTVINKMYDFSKSDPVWNSQEESSFLYQVESDLNIELEEGYLPPADDLAKVLVEKYELKTDSFNRGFKNDDVTSEIPNYNELSDWHKRQALLKFTQSLSEEIRREKIALYPSLTQQEILDLEDKLEEAKELYDDLTY